MKNKLYKALCWSEKYIKTDMVYLARGGFWLTAGQVVSSLATFLLAVAFANLLPKETYGTYKFVLSIVVIISIPTLSGVATSLTRAVARGLEGTINPAIKTRLRWGILASLAGIVIAGYYFFSGNITLAISFLIAATFIPLMDAFNLYDAYLHGKKDFKRLSKYNVYIKITSVSVLVLSIFVANNIFLILLAYFIPYTLLRYVFLMITLKKTPPNPRIDGNAVSYGKHLSLMNIFNRIAIHFDKILLFHFLGAAPVAVYSVATSPLEQIKGLVKNLDILALPKFSEHKNIRGIKKSLKSKVLKTFLILLIVAGAYVLVAPPIFNIFFPDYPESIVLSQIFALSIIPLVLLLPKSAMEAQQKQKELYWFNISTAIVQIVFVAILVPVFGLTGAIAAWIAGRFFNMGVAFFLFEKSTR